MSSSIRGILATDGSRFFSAVAKADQLTATKASLPAPLPDNVLVILTELPCSSEDERKERDELISERFHLNNRTLEFVTRQLDARRANWEQQYELAKGSVRAQEAAIKKLEQTLIDDGREALRADNARRLASEALRNAEDGLQNLSRFSSKAQIAEAEKRVAAANSKHEAAQANSAQWAEHVRDLQLRVIPAAKQELVRLREEAQAFEDLLAGRDPLLSRFGFMR